MKLINVNKSYNTSYGKLQILKNISVSFEKGKFYAIMGRSGSGKSTLVNILGLLDNFDDGDYYLDNINVKQLNDKTKSRIRGLNIGFVFQSFYLNKNLTAYENIIFSLAIKVLILILSSFGITNMWIAVFGDVGVAVIAILNAMRVNSKY